ncbi:hypothetical protein D3C86_851940 [compost metagenome]
MIPLTVTDSGAASPVIAFTLPQPKLVTLTGEQIVELEAILGKPVRRDPAPKFIDVGPVWTIAQLDSADSVLALHPDFARMAAFDKRNADPDLWQSLSQRPGCCRGPGRKHRGLSHVTSTTIFPRALALVIAS